MTVYIGKDHAYEAPDALVEAYEELHTNCKFAQSMHRVLFVQFKKWRGKVYSAPTEDELAEFYKYHTHEEVQQAIIDYLVEDIALYTELNLYGA